MKSLCVFGNFSGRNAGDNALLDSLLEDVATLYPDTRFRIPTIRPSFVRRTYARFEAEPVSLLPWRGSLKILGLPTFFAALEADAILVTDAILFDRGFWNPLHNYLNTLSRVLPLAAWRGIPVILYNCHLGPVSSPVGRRALKRVLASASAIAVRDEDSLRLMGCLGEPTNDVVLGADCALNIRCSPDACVNRIAEQVGCFQSGRPTVSLTVSAYLGAYPGRQPIGHREFVGSFGTLINGLIERLDAEVLLVSTQPMDLPITRAVYSAVGKRERVFLASNQQYSHRDLGGLLRRVQLHVGMRTHSLIFAASQHVPIVGISAIPKNEAFLASIGQQHRAIRPHDDLGTGRDFAKLIEAWQDRETIRSELANIIPEEQRKARKAARLLKPFLATSATEQGVAAYVATN